MNVATPFRTLRMHSLFRLAQRTSGTQSRLAGFSQPWQGMCSWGTAGCAWHKPFRCGGKLRTNCEI
jgi:hypothetical protein